MKDQIKELTPKDMRCTAAACPSIYEEVTPKNMQCTAMACPSIYKKVTPKDMRCTAAVCPEIHEGKDNYLIVGEQVNPSAVGLEGKIGKGEVLISVPKALIDKKEK